MNMKKIINDLRSRLKASGYLSKNESGLEVITGTRITIKEINCWLYKHDIKIIEEERKRLADIFLLMANTCGVIKIPEKKYSQISDCAHRYQLGYQKGYSDAKNKLLNK